MSKKMEHTFEIETYEKLERFMNDLVKKECKNCKKETWHIEVGFEHLECLKCGK
jgi:Zn ribbon nucleic-acid-binding protein